MNANVESIPAISRPGLLQRRPVEGIGFRAGLRRLLRSDENADEKARRDERLRRIEERVVMALCGPMLPGMEAE